MYDLSFLAGFATGDWAWVRDAYLLNPMAGLLTLYRAAILPGYTFPWTPWSVAGLALPAVLLLAGGLVFRKAQRNAADLL
jgi:ABC-type polysaccharide/polyol phosphate export permease